MWGGLYTRIMKRPPRCRCLGSRPYRTIALGSKWLLVRTLAVLQQLKRGTAIPGQTNSPVGWAGGCATNPRAGSLRWSDSEELEGVRAGVNGLGKGKVSGAYARERRLRSISCGRMAGLWRRRTGSRGGIKRTSRIPRSVLPSLAAPFPISLWREARGRRRRRDGAMAQN